MLLNRSECRLRARFRAHHAAGARMHLGNHRLRNHRRHVGTAAKNRVRLSRHRPPRYVVGSDATPVETPFRTRTAVGVVAAMSEGGRQGGRWRWWWRRCWRVSYGGPDDDLCRHGLDDSFYYRGGEDRDRLTEDRERKRKQYAR